MNQGLAQSIQVQYLCKQFRKEAIMLGNDGYDDVYMDGDYDDDRYDSDDDYAAGVDDAIDDDDEDW